MYYLRESAQQTWIGDTCEESASTLGIKQVWRISAEGSGNTCEKLPNKVRLAILVRNQPQVLALSAHGQFQQTEVVIPVRNCPKVGLAILVRNQPQVLALSVNNSSRSKRRYYYL